MRAGVRLIDRKLSDYQRIFKFSDDAQCILRLQLTSAPYTVTLANETIVKGSTVLALHAWNERMPRIPSGGADLEWALKFERSLIHSFRATAQWMQRDPRAEQVCSVYGTSALFSSSDHTGGMRMMQRLGFTVLPYHRPLGRFGEFWENLFSWWLMWAYNDTSLQRRSFWRLQRTEIWMTRTKFLHRFERFSPPSQQIMVNL